MRIIDDVLNKITMYRIVLYELIFLIFGATVLGFFNILPYAPLDLLYSTAVITTICWSMNRLFAWAFDAPSNPESAYITALILVLIITPAVSFGDTLFLAMAFWASALAMASKYLLAIGKKHVFNPAAIAVVITAFVLDLGASWWVGTSAMLPFVLVGGFLVIRKVKRFDLVWAFLISALSVILAIKTLQGGNILSAAEKVVLSTPLIFFASVMLTEPLTTPPTTALQVMYGIVVGALFSPALHIGPVYSTPELALVLGNVFSYAVSPKQKLVLVLKEIKRISTDTYDFIFIQHQNGSGFMSDKRMRYRPGQYMEWTLAHPWSDARGIRRYFTLASSPTERELRLGVKFYPNGSTFKKKFIAMVPGDAIVASGLSGDFTMPKDKKKRLVFIAGGIGVTPFRSMVQYLIDTGEHRDVTLFYSNKAVGDIAYKEIFDRGQALLEIKTIYVVNNPNDDISSLPQSARTIDGQLIASYVPHYQDCIFYLSGPRGMVTSFEKLLASIGVSEKNIKTDFFPGFA